MRGQGAEPEVLGAARALVPATEPPQPARPPTPPPEIPWEERTFALPASHWLACLRRRVALHLRLPRSAKTGVAGSQHPCFKIDNSPLELVRLKCEEAGMAQLSQVRRGKTTYTTFRGLGPMSAYKFCTVEKYKALGQGSAALMQPPRGRATSDVMTIAIPPITAVHIATADTWTLKVDLYLGVFNAADAFTLPVNASTLYAGQGDPTALFKRMALKVLREMCERGLPVSRAFAMLLPPEARPPLPPASSDSDSESELSSESEEEESSSSSSSTRHGESAPLEEGREGAASVAVLSCDMAASTIAATSA